MKRWQLSRRTFLRGTGVCMALPAASTHPDSPRRLRLNELFGGVATW